MSDDDILDITVRLMDGKSYNLQVPRNLLISDFKCLVEEQTNVPPERQRFIFQGQPLQSHKSLSDYNVRTGHVIHLVTRSVDAVNNNNASVNSSGSGFSGNSNANFNNSFSAEGGMPQWRRFPVTMPGSNSSHVMVGEMHIAQGPDGTTTTSWSNGPNAFNNAHDSGMGGDVTAVPQATEFINSIIHSLAHSAATNAASAAATVAHQFVNSGGAVNTNNSNSNFSNQNASSTANNSAPNASTVVATSTNNISTATASSSNVSSSSFIFSESSNSSSSVDSQGAGNTVQSSSGIGSASLPSPVTTAYTFPGALAGGLGGIPGAQRFGPFVMGEYNGIPVAIGGALVGGAPMSPRMFVGGFPGSLQLAGGASSQSNVSNQNNVSINYSSSNSTSGSVSTANVADNSTATTTGNTSSDNSNRFRSQSQGFGALLSNLIQHITPAVTSMTANAVSRYMPNMDGLNDRNDSGGANSAQLRYVANSGDLDATGTVRSTNHVNNQTERRISTSGSGGASNERASSVMREGLHEFIMNISNVMESASKTIHNASLKTAQIANEVMRTATTSTSSSSASSTIYSNSTSMSSSSSNSGFGTIRNTTGTGGTGGRQRLWISNDYVNERLPWDALNELLTLLQEETGWRRPRMNLPSSSNASGTSTVPISVFLSAYGQATNVMLTLFSQLQAWQDGYARLDVPRFGRTVQVLTRTCEIHAQLGSLLTWIFQNMVQHVEPESLNAAMGWSSRIVGSQAEAVEEAEAGRTSGKQVEIESGDKIDDACNEMKSREEEQETQKHDKDDNEDCEFKDIPMEEKGSDEMCFDCKEEDSGSKSIYLQNVINNNEFQNNSNSSNDNNVEQKYEDMPENVRLRFENWTCDNIRFSHSVLSDARSRPFSTSYKSGDATASNSARNSTQEAAERRFSLNWHRALSKLNIINVDQAPEKLNEMYMAWSIQNAIELARNNSDYKAEAERYPGIQKVLELMELIEEENKKQLK